MRRMAAGSSEPIKAKMAQAALMAAEGMDEAAIAERLSVSKEDAGDWLRGLREGGLAALLGEGPQ